MGYYISHIPEQGNTVFGIEKKHFPAIIKLIQDEIENQTIQSWIGRVEIEDGEDPQTAISKILEECRWDPSFDFEGHICDIEFTGEKLGDDDNLFTLLAPYVEAESYITIHGEENSVWRYDFDGKEMEENYAALDFDDNIGIVNKILEQKDILPTLIGIHPKLDARIAKHLDESKK